MMRNFQINSFSFLCHKKPEKPQKVQIGIFNWLYGESEPEKTESIKLYSALSKQTDVESDNTLLGSLRTLILKYDVKARGA